MTWHIWTDGSCVNPPAAQKSETPKGGVGYGGWAAIIEHGSDGFVLRGHVAETTNVVMELVAVIEGLRAVPGAECAIVHTDSTVILSVLDRWQKRSPMLGKHADLWVDLGAEFDRRHVSISMVERGMRDPLHKRAHAIAGAEARALLHIASGRIPSKATLLDPEDRRILGQQFRREVRAWRERHERVNAKPLPSSR
jgi:ribonuclease HI